MKRTLSLFLCLLLLCAVLGGCGAGKTASPGASVSSGAAASGGAPAVLTDFADSVRPQAFAVAMTYWDTGYDNSMPITDPLFLWQATGWYAAWLYRAESRDLLPASQAEAFQRSLGQTGDPGAPENWLELLDAQVALDPDGVLCYDFHSYKQRIDALLGLELDFSVADGYGAVEAVLTDRAEAGQQASWRYLLSFEADGDEAFPYRLTGVTLPAAGAAMDAALGFDWEELAAANRLGNVLARYPALHTYSREYAADMSTWLFLRGGEPVMISLGEGYITGRCRGCAFDYEEQPDGSRRACIGSFSDAGDDRDALDGFLLDYFANVGAMRLTERSGGLIRIDCGYRDGFRQSIAVDADTLVLREQRFDYDDGTSSTNCFDYTESAPAFDFLDSWDRPLRTVTLVWESADGTWTESVEIPGDWELFPYAAAWGEYSVYLDAGHTRPYSYPGDGAGYTLYLTAAG